jgi:hypothetical protein
MKWLWFDSTPPVFFISVRKLHNLLDLLFVVFRLKSMGKKMFINFINTFESVGIRYVTLQLVKSLITILIAIYTCN